MRRGLRGAAEVSSVGLAQARPKYTAECIELSSVGLRSGSPQKMVKYRGGGGWGVTLIRALFLKYIMLVDNNI